MSEASRGGGRSGGHAFCVRPRPPQVSHHLASFEGSLDALVKPWQGLFFDAPFRSSRSMAMRATGVLGVARSGCGSRSRLRLSSQKTQHPGRWLGRGVVWARSRLRTAGLFRHLRASHKGGTASHGGGGTFSPRPPRAERAAAAERALLDFNGPMCSACRPLRDRVYVQRQ